MGQGPGGFGPLYLQVDGVGLARADPDRQSPFLKGVGEKDHGLQGRGVHDQFVDFHLEEVLFFPDSQGNHLSH